LTKDGSVTNVSEEEGHVTCGRRVGPRGEEGNAGTSWRAHVNPIRSHRSMNGMYLCARRGFGGVTS
jgi:hypothetical protein